MVMTKIIRLRVKGATISFLGREAGLSLKDRVRSLVFWEELGIEPLLLHIKRNHFRWLENLVRMPPAVGGRTQTQTNSRLEL